MQINYLDAISSVLNMMKQPDSACKNIDMHRTCYATLFKYLMDKGIPFSMDAALDWLEIKKREISYETCSQYRNALFRLEHYLLFGDIKSSFCRSEDSFFCRSGISESFFRLTYELKEYYATTQNPCYYHTYSVAIKEFFRLATSLGVTEPEAITIDTLIEYWNTYCKSCKSLARRQNAVCAMTALMKYLHRRGDVPECYQRVLFGENVEILLEMRLSKTGTAFHPSIPLALKADEYLDALDDWKYMKSSKAVYRNDFTWYFMFLELNHLEHSAETVTSWIDILPDCPNQIKASSSGSAHRSHTIRMFEKYLQGIMESNIIAEPMRASDQLPSWSKSILDGFIESRRRDGMTDKTLTMCRAAGCSFFKYLEDNGIDNPVSITPDVVKAFHNHDVHSTPESKNAYGTKLRQLLRYMADQDLISPTLAFAVSASCAPHRSIVDVLSDAMVEKIYEYREKASTPMELRDTAMVMLGLRMGIRGADILREALHDILEDLKSQPDYNGAKGNIQREDELIPMDYDGLMEKAEEANRIIPESTPSSVVADFRAKTGELFHDISEMNPEEIEETVKCHVQAKIDEYNIDATIVDVAVTGSRCRGLEHESSDLDVVVELSTAEREDDLFNAFNEGGLHIGEVKVDINPITAQRTGTLETYLPQVEEYLEGVRQAREQEKEKAEVTLTVSECGEFHNLGECYENIPTVDEAIAIWKQIPSERMNGIPAIGINIIERGAEPFEDYEIDVLSGKRIDLGVLDYVPDIKNNPQAMEVITELVAKLPDMEIDGVMSEEMEARVWELRMPDLPQEEQLAVELDRLCYDYDTVLYHDSTRNMTENVSELAESIKQGDTGHLTTWLADIISEGAVPEEIKRATELLEKLTEYKPLAKIEEAEEQNYNMIDNVLNNGVGEKAQREENKRMEEKPTVRISLKSRLAEKKSQVEGQSKEHDVQENEKKSQREM